MKDFIIYLLQVACCLGIFSMTYYLFLRKQTFFLFNRIYLLVGLIGSFLFPFLQFSYTVIINSPTTSLNESSNEVITEASATSVYTIWLFILVIYLTGLMFIVTRNINSYIKLYRIKKEGKCTKTNGYVLVESEKAGIAFSTLNYIFINSNKLQVKEKEIIIKHELKHIKQKHWIDLICGECALILQWFNPIIWLYIHWIKENHEYLADQAVLEAGESSTIYRAVLINQQFQKPLFSFTNTFSYPNHLNRLNMMKKEKTKSWKKIRVLTILPLMGMFFTLSAKPNYVEDENTKTSKTNKIELVNSTKDKNPPIVFVNGKKESSEILNTINANAIESFSIIKGQESIEKYGEEGKHGVILLTLKENKDSKELKGKIQEIKVSSNSNVKVESIPLESKPLIVIDGEIMPELKDTSSIDPKTIEKISVLKGEHATNMYGDKGKNGVILITLKKEAE